MTDETLLQAYLDGELTSEEEHRLEARLLLEPALQARLDQLTSLHASLRQAFEAPMLEEPPARLTKVFAAATAPPSAFDRWSRSLRRWVLEQRSARLRGFAVGGLAAAGLALVVLAVPAGQGGGLALGVLPKNAVLATALESDVTGAERRIGEKSIVQLGTFIDRQNRPCREFEFAGAHAATLEVGVACRDQIGRWTVEFAVAAEPVTLPDGTLRPAAGPAVDAMSALLDGLGAGPLLGPDEEKTLIENGWR